MENKADATIVECLECGSKFQAKRSTAAFCGSKCRLSFNNRRRERGAILYDLVMLNRYERKFAYAKGAWSLMCKLARWWREDDQRIREGRRSWQDGQTAMQNSAWANAKRM